MPFASVPDIDQNIPFASVPDIDQTIPFTAARRIERLAGLFKQFKDVVFVRFIRF